MNTHLLIVMFDNRREYHGPFDDMETALDYGRACKLQLEGVVHYMVLPLIAPAKQHSIDLKGVKR